MGKCSISKKYCDDNTVKREGKDESDNLRIQMRSCVSELIPIGDSFGELSSSFFGLHTGDVSNNSAIIQVGYEAGDAEYPNLIIRIFYKDDI